MSPGSETQPRTAGGLEVFHTTGAIDLAKIEHELRGLWKQAAEQVEGENRPPVTRVSTVNLVVLARGTDEADSAAMLAVDISARHPGRLLVVEENQGPDSIAADISAHCHLGGGGRQVCSEQVRLTVSGRANEKVAQLLAPLLIPDLPTMLWIAGDPGAATVGDHLLKLGDLVIVDSRCSYDCVDTLERLAAWSDGGHGTAVIDLCWLRLERWRSLTAQLFNDAEALADLEHLEHAEVVYFTGAGDAPEGRVEALYFLGAISFRKGDYGRTASIMERVVTAVPGHPEARYYLGMAYRWVGRDAEAKEQFEIHKNITRSVHREQPVEKKSPS